MKKTIVLLSTIMLLFAFQRCNQDEDVTPSEKTNVTFGFSSSDAINGRKKTDISESTMLVISIETSTGESVLSHYSLALLSFGDGYVTEPIELVPGNYVITDFMLVDNSDVLFATPHGGSPLAPIVKHPLPYAFKVDKNKLNNVKMQVVAVDEQTPEDFGYASFHVDIVKPLSFAVFAMGNTPKLTKTNAYLLKDADTLEVYHLEAKVNVLGFKHDPDETYSLIVEKAGYVRFTKTFTYNELMTELDGHPLNAYLEPALTIKHSVHPVDHSGYISFILEVSSAANFIINWGDGSTQNVSIDADDYPNFYHTYNSGQYYTAITGDLEKLIGYSSVWNDTDKQQFTFDNLPNLKIANLFQENYTEVLDLRKNKKIEHIVFGGKTLLLPTGSNLKIVVIFGEDLAPSLDNIIDQVYQNAVARNIMNGVFWFTDGPTSDVPMATPSAESLDKLVELQNLYNWEIYPELVF